MMLLVTMGAGSMYGLFLGCLLGTVSPWVDDWPGTSLRGALVWGSIMTLMLAVGSAVTLAVMTWKDRRGPAVRGLQPIVRAAIRKARNRCDDRVRPGHLLLALLDDANELTGLLPDAPRQAAWRHLDDLLPTFFPSGDDEDRFLDTEPIHDSLTTAVDEARRLKHRAVETGHVLLALLDQWPEEAARTLAIAGLAPATQRDQILDWLRRSLP
jgi:hypothetical protein